MLAPFILPIVTDQLQKEIEDKLNEVVHQDGMKYFYPVPYIEKEEDKKYSAYYWRYVIKVDETLVGYISADFDPNTNTITNLGFCKFEREKTEMFNKCLLNFIVYCFKERDIQAITMKSIPGCQGHKYIMKRFVNQEHELFTTEIVGELKRSRKLRDGTVHSTTIFQMLKR
jgi:hypothetical protein